MADPTLAKKDPATVLAEALALFKASTVSAENPSGITLAPADPRRLFLQTIVLLLAQQRQLIDFSGKQSFLRFVSDAWISFLAELWGEQKLPPKASECTQRFFYADNALHTVPAGTRVTDGISIWRVIADTVVDSADVDARVECEVPGGSTNGVAVGQIDTVVDPSLVPGCLSTANITETSKGRELETLEDFRARLRNEPEARSTCGPRTAYDAGALEASATVADAATIGPNDEGLAGSAPNPGQVFVLILKGLRDENGKLVSVVPEPDSGLLIDVYVALSPEDARPLTDLVTVKAPAWSDFDSIATYYIPRSREESSAAIQAACEEAFAAYVLWQESKIGRDINPSELTTRLVNAGAKRAVVSSPAYTVIRPDESARCVYQALVFGGVEND